jgi:hypothetical protein
MGVKLLPYSLGHHILMMRENCALASDDIAKGSGTDLYLAIAICSRPHYEFDDWMASGQYIPFCKRWRKAILQHLRQNKKNFTLLDKFNLFKAYMARGCELPKIFTEKSQKQKNSGTHWTEVLSLTLQKEFHKTEKEVLSMPMNKALRQYFIHLESLDEVTIKGDNEPAPLMSTVVVGPEEINNGNS